jgi:uncharacterized protein YecE (DUF72 family)
MAMGGQVLIGISGWRYAPWRGTFYPPGTPQSGELAYASRRLGTIEINGSFYSLQRPASYRAWRDATPEGFVFAVKGGRFITHIKRLREVRTPLANFFASGVLALGDKLGPVLWQLPPWLKFDAAVVDDFLRLLPRSTGEAAALCRRHDSRLKHRAHCRAGADRPLRHVLEVRHDSFVDPAFVALLRAHSVALCVADNARGWPVLADVTADFVYCRLHGHTRMYASGYSSPALDRWADRIRAWKRGGQADGRLAAPGVAPRRTARDVYVYFDNDAKIRAPYDAMNLAARIHGAPRVAFPRGFRGRGEEPRGTSMGRRPGAEARNLGAP